MWLLSILTKAGRSKIWNKVQVLQQLPCIIKTTTRTPVTIKDMAQVTITIMVSNIPNIIQVTIIISSNRVKEETKTITIIDDDCSGLCILKTHHNNGTLN